MHGPSFFRPYPVLRLRPWLGLVLGVWLCLGGCVDHSLETPVPPEQFREILLEMYILEKGLSPEMMPTPQRDSVATLWYHQILARHQVSAADFLATYDAYLKAPKAFHALHEQMLEKLNEQP